jgi:hypothetical protein
MMFNVVKLENFLCSKLAWGRWPNLSYTSMKSSRGFFEFHIQPSQEAINSFFLGNLPFRSAPRCVSA